MTRESTKQSHERAEQPPLMQRLYNRIWLLAAAALVFFFVTYVGWGLMDGAAIPPG